MSEAKPKRKFWQIHLSTAVLSTVLAGWLLGSQFLQKFSYDNTVPFSNGWIERKGWIEQGWPFPVYKKQAIIFASHHPDYAADTKLYKSCFDDYVEVNGIGFATPLFPYEKKVSLVGTILDSLIAMLILSSVVLSCEWLIRRREARKT